MYLLLSIVTIFVLASDQFSIYNLEKNVWKEKFKQRKTNSTILFKLNNTSFYNYIIIELSEITKKKDSANLILLQSYTQPPYIDDSGKDKKIVSDNVDLKGKILSKKYHHIILKKEVNNNPDFYLTVYTNETIHYSLSISQHDYLPCPKNCSNHGVCQNGKCYCDNLYIDEDCSKKARNFLSQIQLQDIVFNKHKIYFYSNITQFESYNLNLKMKFQESEGIKLKIQLLVSSDFQVPENTLKDFEEIVEITNELDFNWKIIAIQDSQSKQLNQQDYNQSQTLVIKISSDKKLNFDYSLLLKKRIFEKSRFNFQHLIMIIIFGLSTIIAICVLYRYCKGKDLQPIKKAKQITINDECTICLDNFEQNEAIILNNCVHFFHELCIEEWKRYRNTCPICRKQIN